jgi:hypothetical protein
MIARLFQWMLCARVVLCAGAYSLKAGKAIIQNIYRLNGNAPGDNLLAADLFFASAICILRGAR